MKPIIPVAAVAALLVAGRRFRNWGASKGECETSYPGDELVADPAEVTTRAVTVDAPAEEVWRWLVQIGQDRGGFYSYQWLENVAGLHIHNTDEIRDEWQHLRVGDTVRLVPPGWLGSGAGVQLPVASIEPGRSIVLREPPGDLPWDAIWSFHIVPEGPHRCRLISRGRTHRGSRAAWLAAEAMDPVAMVMTRAMLLGIKRRAEASAGRSHPSPELPPQPATS